MREHSTAIACTMVMCFSGGHVAAQTRSLEQRVDQIDQYITRMHDFGAFDGVLLLAQGEDVLLAKGWGDADREAGRPWTAEAVSTTGSLTKQFTGAALTLLVQDGVLNFSDSIGDFFPDAPADKTDITIHQLLTHSAGFPDAIGDDLEYINREDYLARAWETDLDFEPGDHYEYSNVGYSIAAAILEEASGQSYEQFLSKRLFRPAGMRDTGYKMVSWSPDRIAVGYRKGERGGTVLEYQTRAEFSRHLIGNGGIHTTVGDMHKWWLAIRNNLILDAEHTATYLAPHQDEGGGSYYAYGWVNFEAPNGERVLSHNGGNGYYFADCAFFPESDQFVYLMTNDPGALGIDTLDFLMSFAGGDLAMPPDPATTDMAALARTVRARAHAYVDAFNSGPDAYVQYGFDHRIDQGRDAELNEGRRNASIGFREEFGMFEIVGESMALPMQYALHVRASATGDTWKIMVTVDGKPPHLVSAIELGEDGQAGEEAVSPEEALERAQELLEQNEIEEAIALLGQLVHIDSENGEAWFLLGYATLISDDNDGAVEPLERAIALGFENDRALYNLACAHAKAGRADAAIDALGRAVDVGFTNAQGMRTDPDLHTIREHERFAELLKKAENQ